MSLVKVYRVEGRDGIGPYNNPDYEGARWQYAHTPYNGHPSWKTDVFDYWNDNDVTYNIVKKMNAGFLSIRQLFAWFGGYLPYFYLKTDLRVVTYMVEEHVIMTTRSGKQILFSKPGDAFQYDNTVAEVDFEEITPGIGIENIKGLLAQNMEDFITSLPF